MKHYWLFIACLLVACQKNEPLPTTTEASTADSGLEAREDAQALTAAYAAQEEIEFGVSPAYETRPIQAGTEEDAADDPAIWIHPTNSAASVIYGSNKRGGLAAYNLQAEEVAYYPLGNVNNVDILYGFPMGDSLVSLLGCSNRSDQSIDLLLVNAEDGSLTNIAAGPLLVDPNLIDDVYGFCFAHDEANDRFYAVINGKNGRLQQFELLETAAGIDLELRRSHQFPSQTEGMVADNAHGQLYVGEEGQGIWKMPIDPETVVVPELLKNSGAENPQVVYDIEGLTIYEQGEAGYLLASVQGNFSYAVFERTGDNRYLGSFKIVDDSSQELDGVEETDGLAVVSDSLSPGFAQGLLVLQDGFNFAGETPQPQNFKLVDWRPIGSWLAGMKQ